MSGRNCGDIIILTPEQQYNNRGYGCVFWILGIGLFAGARRQIKHYFTVGMIRVQLGVVIISGLRHLFSISSES